VVRVGMREQVGRWSILALDVGEAVDPDRVSMALD